MLLIYFGYLLVLNIVLSLSFYFDLINENTLNILNLIFYFIITFISAFYIGKRSNYKSYTESLIFSFIFIFISLFFILILPSKFNLNDLYNYIFIILISFISIKISKKYKIKNKN